MYPSEAVIMNSTERNFRTSTGLGHGNIRRGTAYSGFELVMMAEHADASSYFLPPKRG